MAGKAGKCPHCNTRFLVPQLENPPEEAPPAASSPAAQAALAGGSAVRQQASPPADSIVFYCPNGHKLNGPASLRGKLGLCPHCQSKFRIPSEDVPPAPPQTASGGSDDSTETSAGAAASAPAAPPPPPEPPSASARKPTAPSAAAAPSATSRSGAFIDEVPHAEILDDDLDVVEGQPLESTAAAPEANVDDSPSAWNYPAPPPLEASRWSELFTWIWTQRDLRSVVDLHLKNGEVFQPTWYAPGLSDARLGVFGLQADDGTYGITILPWDTVERITVRGCEHIPFDQFE